MTIVIINTINAIKYQPVTAQMSDMPIDWSDYVRNTADIAHHESVGVVVGFKARTPHLTKR